MMTDKLQAIAAQQRSVGSIPYQRMLERVDRVRWRSTRQNTNSNSTNCSNAVVIFACWQPRCHGDQRVGELAADCGARLRDLIDR